MRVVALAHAQDFEGWRAAARTLAVEGVPAAQVEWRVGPAGGGLFDAPAAPPPDAPAFAVPRAFMTLAETAIRHDDPERFALLYALLLRLRARPGALDEGQPLVQRLEAMAREVRRREIGRKLGGAALSEAEMAQPRTRLSPAEQAGLATADAAERRIEPGGNLLRVWEEMLADAKSCTRCHLYKHATRTVFGEGPLDARIMFVGEQPGDQEDLAGRPFVGPAGQLFDRALADAGIDRKHTYVTNAVKHFKFEPRGKRRIHSRPQGPEIEACRWWIEQERALIRPPLTVALGATAARSLFGRVVTISRMRGAPHALPDGGGEAWVTVHPSFLLRVRDGKEAEYARFVEDLRRIGERAGALT